MSNIAVSGGMSGSGTVSLIAPSTNTDRSLTLPDSSGVVQTVQGVLDQFNVTGSAPVFACRAWVNFDGTAAGTVAGTNQIMASGNVSSVTDNGVGLYGINFTIPLIDSNYSVSGITNSPGNGALKTVQIISLTPSGFTVRTPYGSGTLEDSARMLLSVHR